MLALVFSLIIHVAAGGSVNAALDSARAVYAARGEYTTILIEPGTYREELTIDVPHLTLKNASPKPSIRLRHNGVEADPQAVRLTWYYGHGYQYASMGQRVNYGGSRERRWNASVLVTAPYFRAEGIIFENSFNLYVCDAEAADTLVDISRCPMPWTEKERPKKTMPERPKTAGSTEVQLKRFRERAAAISFTETAAHAHLSNCRAVGRQDVVYGDQGASVYWEGGILQGGVDFIFGAMTMVADHATIVANINGEKNDHCYISAGRSGSEQAPSRGLLFYHCHIRPANQDELALTAGGGQKSDRPMVYLARPWRPWGETVWAYTTWDRQTVCRQGWSLGLVEKRPDFVETDPCPNSYEYRSQDRSKGRPGWVRVLSQPVMPDGTRLTPEEWLR